MATKGKLHNAILDGYEALKLVSLLSWQRNLKAYVYVPIGILLMLLACFGVNSLIGLSSVSFPASVACLILLFTALVVVDVVIGDRKTRALVSVIDVPAGFALRYLNIFFTPSFVLLPLSPPIGGIEVGKIMTVFLLGFFVIMTATAYFVRGLQLVLGSSKRTMTERAEELGNESDMIPLADATPRHNSVASLSFDTHTPPAFDLTNDLIAPQRTQDPSMIRGTGGPPESNISSQSLSRTNQILQAPFPLTRPQRWAAFINVNLDRLTYLLLFIFVGLPIYYTTGYAMPAQVTFTTLCYFTALALPITWRKVLHPVLVSSALTILGIWIIGLSRGDSLSTTLSTYKTGTTYLDIWHGEKHLKLPGAGDILVSILDAGIVALALPMFSYRQELKRHFFAIVIPNIAVSIGSLFGYPVLSYAIGISSKRSLAFAVRSLTLALATPAGKNLGADTTTVAALAICSGILGALIGSQTLDWLRIPEDDYVTRGVTLGGSSSAIATAVLLQSDPRAAALSSLSMSLFGIITLALTSVPAIVKAVDSLVNL